jgi:hypothetical protein
MSQANVDLVRSIYEAFAAGDMPAVLARLHPEMIWMEAENHPYADRNPYEGHEAILGGLFARLGGE